MRLLRLITVSVVMAITIIGLAGCAKTKTEVSPAGKVTKLRISGSGTAYPLIKILADDYHRRNPEVEFFFLPSVHSKGGIEGAANGTLDIGMVSRELTQKEKELGLTYTLLSDDGLAVATHPDTRITSLSKDVLKRIYSGEVSNWKEVGGPDGAIIVLDRNEDESAKMILRKYILGSPEFFKTTDRAVILYYEKDMITSLKDTPSSIGYLSLGSAVSQKLGLNLVAVDGVAPSVQNIMDAKYPIIRPLGIVTKEKVSDAARSFIDFATAKEGRELMLRNGFAPAK
ncbi:MAG: phosphate ABC transporter substrate-binding protein [Actinobacteria bacterium]|nr:phosphate ABC transporter substrate-binding protein [Actinomycetota bacterium]